MSNIIEINEDKFQFKVKGQMLEISQATVPQEINHQNKLKNISDDGGDLEKLYEANIEYLVLLGGNEQILRNVSRNGLLQIIRTVDGSSEKK